LDRNLKLLDYKIYPTNFKQMILSDEHSLPLEQSKIVQNNEIKSVKNGADVLHIINSNLVPFEQFRYDDDESSNKKKFDFIFMVLGSNESNLTKNFLKGLVEFWKKFHLKYKFQVVYFSLETVININFFEIVGSIPWYIYDSSEIELKVKNFYL
jgi:hypothetical protein